MLPRSREGAINYVTDSRSKTVRKKKHRLHYNGSGSIFGDNAYFLMKVCHANALSEMGVNHHAPIGCCQVPFRMELSLWFVFTIDMGMTILHEKCTKKAITK